MTKRTAVSWCSLFFTCLAAGCATEEGEPGVTRDALTGAFLVDDDGAQCPTAAFQSIQAAVDAAPAGAIVQVCAGTYAENVRVNRTLTLRGAKFGQDARNRTLSSTGESIVIDDRPFVLGADDVVLDGFTVIVVVDESGEGAGIRTSNEFSGYRVINNVADADGVTALFPGSNGVKQSIARRNHFYNRLGVAGSPDEPFVDPRNLLVEQNLFTNSSILMRGFDVIIRANKFEGGGTIAVTEAERIAVIGNKLFNPEDRAIAVGSDASQVLVQDNLLRNGLGDGLFAQGAEGLSLVANRIAGFAGAGIHLVDISGVQARLNEVEDSVEGLRLAGGGGNVIENNDVEDNQFAGILVEAAAAGNRLTGNHVRGNGPPDCRDDSIGDQTAGTANTWIGNEGSTSDPPGLCADTGEAID